MFTKNKKLRIIATFLLVNFIFDLALPTITYALTAGPTAPEATSFEPVDTTDMVSLLSGDFTYNMPLLEVPGPGGGYPLSLSYHAGIQPDLEAGWVGLGWTLNPGAINRFVNGYADDWNQNTITDNVYWEGGETTTHTISLSYGISDAASVNANLVFANDTYEGFGVGGSLGVSVRAFNEDESNSIGASASIGISPYGEMTTSAGINLGIGQSSENAGAGVGIGLGFSSVGNRSSVGASAGMQISGKIGENRSSSFSPMSVSISSGTSKANLSVGGISGGFNNNNKGKVSESSFGFSTPPIPILPGLFISYSYAKRKYWIDEKVHAKTYGILNYPEIDPLNMEKSAFDSRDLPEISSLSNDRGMGGVMPNYDDYQISAQGLSGSMQPYVIQKSLLRQTIKEDVDGDGNEDLTVLGVNLNENPTNKDFEFRFANEFTNKVISTQNDLEVDPTLTNQYLKKTYTPVETGDGILQGIVDNRIVGNRAIEWYTNAQLLGLNLSKKPFLEGFVESENMGLDRTEFQVRNLIGGFMISNESGVNYHFGLPVHSYDEFQKSETIDDSDGDFYNSLTRYTKYAANWRVTGITGPDYLDANNNNKLDDGDWGYWVAFDYGKWTNDYIWRNPAQNFHSATSDNIQSYSRGKKEIYYLNAIRTSTHTALFFKEERMDSRGVKDGDLGGFDATGVKSLRLSEIGLIKNDNLKQALGVGTVLEAIATIEQAGTKNNILDVHDLNALKTNTVYTDYLLKSIAFNHSYELCRNTPNSFDDSNIYKKLGKLSLKSVETYGKSYADILPPVYFDYGINDPSKNPNYKKDYVDYWGNYKSDFVDDDLIPKTIQKMPTHTSAKDVDAWSLRRIVSPIGSEINIDYDTDSYSKSEYNNKYPFRINSFEKITNDTDRFNLKVEWYSGLDLTDYLKEGDSLDIIFYGTQEERQGDNLWLEQPYLFKDIGATSTCYIESINSNTITVYSPQYYRYFYAVGSEEYTRNRTPMKGNFGVKWGSTIKGGGLRVAEISVADKITGKSRSTLYDYSIPGTSVSSGITSYEPVGIDEIKVGIGLMYDETKRYNELLATNYSRIIRDAGLIPAPGVMYEYVTMREKTTDSNGVDHYVPGSSTYHFDIFSKDLVKYDAELPVTHNQSGTIDSYAFSKAETKSIVIQDFTNIIGNLKSVTLYDNNNLKLSETKFHYLHDAHLGNWDFSTAYPTNIAQRFNSQGVIQEEYSDGKLVYDDGQYILRGTTLKYEKYPAVQIGTSNTNFRTGITTRTDNLKYDFYSGQVLETMTTNAKGSKYITRTTPAYRISEYSEMGPKGVVGTNKNMLTQSAVTSNFQVNDNYYNSLNDLDLLVLVGSDVQKWSKEIDLLDTTLIRESYPFDNSAKQIWRKQSNYTWNGTNVDELGMGIINDYQAFDAWSHGSEPIDAMWEKMNEITLYDLNSHALEAKDMNGIFSATKYTSDFSKVLTSGPNAQYHEIAFSGAEDDLKNSMFGGNILPGEASVYFSGTTSPNIHTGSFSLKTSNANKGFYYMNNLLNQGRNYRVSAWVSNPNGQIQYKVNNGTTQSFVTNPEFESNGWYLIDGVIPLPTGSKIEVWTQGVSSIDVYHDDFMFRPVDSGITGYVYDQLTDAVTYIINNNGLYTHYHYNDMGQLKLITQERLKVGEVVMAEFDLEYAVQK